jgi:S1-C subfamily serine protease
MMSTTKLAELAKALAGVAILGSLPNSPAARAGLRYGDVLLSLNGHRTRTLSDYLGARDEKASQAVATIFRQGEELTVVLDMTTKDHARDLLSVLEHLIASGVGAPPAQEPEPGAAS